MHLDINMFLYVIVISIGFVALAIGAMCMMDMTTKNLWMRWVRRIGGLVLVILSLAFLAGIEGP